MVLYINLKINQEIMPSFFNKTSTAVILLFVIIVAGGIMYYRNKENTQAITPDKKPGE